MRLVFAGTPAPAVVALRALLDSRHEVAAVVTRPEARAGRGRSLTRSDVHQVADEAGIEALTPTSARDPEFATRLAQIAPDAAPVVAYGGLIPRGVLEIPAQGWINLHFSLLPAWRGAAPVQAAIAAGDEVTGATTFLIEPSLDSGPVYGVVTERIRPDDTAGDLLGRLSASGALLLESTLDGIADGSLTAVPQPAEGITVAPKITVEEARVRWDLPAHVVDRRIRAVTPNPGAWTMIGDLRVKLGPVTVSDGEALPQGRIAADRDGVRVGTATAPVTLGWIQPPGKKPMAASDWARGARLDETASAS